MKDRRLPLMNLHEEAAYRLILPTTSRHDAEVWTKIRLKDVIDIEGSGLPKDLRGYAFGAHFDHVVADTEKHMPLFAMEVDGPGHDPANDAKKNRFCEFFEFPLVRIRVPHLVGSENG